VLFTVDVFIPRPEQSAGPARAKRTFTLAFKTEAVELRTARQAAGATLASVCRELELTPEQLPALKRLAPTASPRCPRATQRNCGACARENAVLQQERGLPKQSSGVLRERFAVNCLYRKAPRRLSGPTHVSGVGGLTRRGYHAAQQRGSSRRPRDRAASAAGVRGPCRALGSRRVIGWAMDRTITRALPLAALHMALLQRHHPTHVIHHSDRGRQPEFNRSSQRYDGIVAVRSVLRQASSSRVTSAAGC